MESFRPTDVIEDISASELEKLINTPNLEQELDFLEAPEVDDTLETRPPRINTNVDYHEDTLAQFVKRSGMYPRLTKDDEFSLGEKMARGRDAQSNIDALPEGDRPAPADRRAVKVADEAKELMIMSNIGLVIARAKKYRTTPNIDRMDLIQEGVIGLNRAAEKFDHTLGWRFSTYATDWIAQAMDRLYDAHSRTISVPADRGNAYRSELAQSEDAAELSEFSALVHQAGSWLSLNSLSDDGDRQLQEAVASNEPSAETAAVENIDYQEKSDTVNRLLEDSGLSDLERTVLRRRMMFDGPVEVSAEGTEKKVSYAVIGKEVGQSFDQARKIYNRSMAKVKKAAETTATKKDD